MTSESMARALALLLALDGSVVACHQDSTTSPGRATPPWSSPAIGSISPTGAIAGSPDLTLTLKGSGFRSGHLQGSRAAWRTGDDTTYLTTTFVSSTELTAVIPAELLREVVAAHVYVATGDIMGDVPLAASNALAFTVTPAATSKRGPLESISPASAAAGSSDLTVTLKGSGFGGNHIFVAKAVWFARGTNTDLLTTYVDSTQLTAVVPAALLTDAVTAQVRVEVTDRIENVVVRATNTVTFTVTPH